MNPSEIIELTEKAASDADIALTDELARVNISRTPSSGILYHYTNALGLKGIIESNKLWATDLTYMNDSQELAYGQSLVKTVALEILNEEESDPYTSAFLNTVINLTDSSYNFTKNMYACCFSSNGDQLSQWRGYTGQSIGYSIGFDASVLYHNTTHMTNFFTIIYELDTQLRLIRILLSTFTSAFKAKEGVKIDETQFNRQLYQYGIGTLFQAIDLLCASFKHSGFAEEHEARLILTNEKPKIREKNGVLIPYCEIQMENDYRLPITEIIIGPSEHFDRNAQTVIALLEANPRKRFFPNFRIGHSEISFRNT